MSMASLAAASNSSPRREGAGADVAAEDMAESTAAARLPAPVVRRILELPAWLRASTSCRMNLQPLVHGLDGI